MPTSVLDSSVLDGLIPVVDEIRASVHEVLGSRQHRVELIRRQWSGGRTGSGTPSLTYEQTISPPPLLARWGVTGKLIPCGLDEDGELVLVEISLMYQEAELYLPDMTPGTEFYYKVSDAHGQGVRTRTFLPKGPPQPIRSGEEGLPEHPLGWSVTLIPYNLSGSPQ